MMIEDNYSINIAIDGKHWAKVELGGWQSEEVALDKARIIQERFPEAEVTLMKVICRGHEIEL